MDANWSNTLRFHSAPLKHFQTTRRFTEPGASGRVGVCVLARALAADLSSRPSNAGLRRSPRGGWALNAGLPSRGFLALVKMCHWGTLSRPGGWWLPSGLLVACWWLVGGYPVGGPFGLQSVPRKVCHSPRRCDKMALLAHFGTEAGAAKTIRKLLPDA